MSRGEFSGVVIGNKVGNKKPLVPSSFPSVPETLDSKPKSRNKMFSTRGVGTRGAQGHMPPHNFEQLVHFPPQQFYQTLRPTKCVSLQYFTPSYAPEHET